MIFYLSRIFFCITAFATCSLAVGVNPPDTSGTPTHSTKLTPLMLMKLEKSKEILEGLTLEDFDKIKSNADMLKMLSLESGWNVIQTEEYGAQSTDFRRAAELIAKAADEKDIHRATLGYVALTVRCVECHSYMRRHRSEQIKLKTE